MNGRVVALAGIALALFVACGGGSRGDGEAKPTTAPVTTAPSAAESRQIVFTTGNGIYISDSDGSNLTLLTDHDADHGCPSWSPDGSRIAFMSDRDGQSDLYVMKPAGTKVTKLTNSPEIEIQHSWSPDGTRIAVAAISEIATIFVINRDGSGHTPLGTGQSPSWSPDGYRLAYAAFPDPLFISDRDPGGPGADIYVVDVDTSNAARLTDGPGSNGFPAWSPDGSRIVFVSSRDGNSEIYAMNQDGTGARNLTNDPGTDQSFAWSPDSSQIAFISDRTGAGELFVMNADGTGQMQLSEYPEPLVGGGPWAPSWSPDGTQIAYLGNGITVIDVDGTHQAELTASVGGFSNCPEWSPVP